MCTWTIRTCGTTSDRVVQQNKLNFSPNYLEINFESLPDVQVQFRDELFFSTLKEKVKFHIFKANQGYPMPFFQQGYDVQTFTTIQGDTKDIQTKISKPSLCPYSIPRQVFFINFLWEFKVHSSKAMHHTANI